MRRPILKSSHELGMKLRKCLPSMSEALSLVSSCHDAAEIIWDTACGEELQKSSEDAIIVSSIWGVLPQQ